jgi:STE24 endopeptidase
LLVHLSSPLLYIDLELQVRWLMLRVPRPPAADPRRVFSEEEIRASVADAWPRQRWGLVAIGVDLLLLVVLALTGPGRQLVRAAADAAGGSTAGRAALAALTVLALQALARLPFSLRSWRQDRRQQLSTQRLGAWLADWAKARALTLLLGVPALTGLVLAARGLPGFPLTAAVAAAGLVVALTAVGPVLIEPVFNRFQPLTDASLRDRVLRLAARMGVPVKRVLLADASRRTRRTNAYVSGLGRRVVVYDTLAGSTPPEEILHVLAHEFAHVRHRDVVRGTAAAAASAAAAVLLLDQVLALPAVARALQVDGLGDPLALPAVLLLAAAGSLLAAPAAGAVSRWAEARADWAALNATRDPDTAVRLWRRLALDNRTNLRPNPLLTFWFATHPPVMARITQAWLWRERSLPTPTPQPQPSDSPT